MNSTFVIALSLFIASTSFAQYSQDDVMRDPSLWDRMNGMPTQGQNQPIQPNWFDGLNEGERQIELNRDRKRRGGTYFSEHSMIVIPSGDSNAKALLSLSMLDFEPFQERNALSAEVRIWDIAVSVVDDSTIEVMFLFTNRTALPIQFKRK